MAILQIFRRLREVLQTVRQDLPHEEEYERFATDAYTACCEWFGTPSDAKRSYYLLPSSQAINSACCYSYTVNGYMIFLAAKLDSSEARCSAIGHEMYHRVTMRRNGVRREAWIDEVMACLAAHWFLLKCGHTDFAARFREHHTRRSTPIALGPLKLLKRPRGFRFFLSGQALYPEHFYSDVIRIGVALEALVGSLSLCELPWSRSLADWIESLPEDVRGAVSDILLTPGQQTVSPEDIGLRCKYGRALRLMGRLEDSLRELMAVTHLAPEEPEGHFQIAFTLKNMGRREEALAAWMRTAELNPESSRAAYSIANLFYMQDDHPEAIRWYREALCRKPEWPKALYYLGAALAYDGQREEARECWQRVIELGDTVYYASARGSLEAWQEIGKNLDSRSKGL